MNWFKVTNLTSGWITLPHPENINDTLKAETFSPYQVKIVPGDLFDENTKQGFYNRDMANHGYISIEPTEAFGLPDEDKQRRAALSENVALADPQLEYLARQILECPVDVLPDAIQWTSDGLAKTEPGIVVRALIEAEPRKGGGQGNRGPVDYDYLVEVQRPFLMNVLAREKLWKNRPSFVRLMEQRIAELEDTTLLKAQSNDKLSAFRAQLGSRL